MQTLDQPNHMCSMIQTDYSDQTRIFNPENWGWPIHLVGAGGINNCLAVPLAKLGIAEIHAWDNDILEARNCPTEIMYSYNDLGKPKVTAMANSVYRVMPWVKFYEHQERVTAKTKLSGVVVCGVDSMASRKEIWRCVKNNLAEVPLFIDGRSGGELTQIFAFQPSDLSKAEEYEHDWLFDDAYAARLGCGARNIGYISLYMAYRIERIITRFYRERQIMFYDPINHAAYEEEEY